MRSDVDASAGTTVPGEFSLYRTTLHFSILADSSIDSSRGTGSQQSTSAPAVCPEALVDRVRTHGPTFPTFLGARAGGWSLGLFNMLNNLFNFFSLHSQNGAI